MDNAVLNIKELALILVKLEAILDKLLFKQEEIHECVRERKWSELEANLEVVRLLSDSFVELDRKREELTDSKMAVYSDKELAPLFAKIRTKLMKSKIENEALSKYVQSAQSFVYKVIEQCAPQQRATVYTRNGNIRKTAAPSLVVNAVF